jgi:hypothetical protein
MHVAEDHLTDEQPFEHEQARGGVDALMRGALYAPETRPCQTQ